MNYICTWFYADKKGEESLFPQTGKLSSLQSHQNIYWRCIVLFFITSKRFNKNEKHLLFTNLKVLPILDGKSVDKLLTNWGVEIVLTEFNHKPPKNYYSAFQNQFYIFSIMERIVSRNGSPDDNYLILDSDCVFIKPVDLLFKEAAPSGFISFEDAAPAEIVINGLSRNDLKDIYGKLLHKKIDDLPSYHIGEFYLSSVRNLRKFYNDFVEMWPEVLKLHERGEKKFNEEAHTLSFLYYKNGFRARHWYPFMKRIWTNPLFYRNAEPKDVDLIIWHLPAEKTFGLRTLYDYFMNKAPNYGFDMTHDNYLNVVQDSVSVPALSTSAKLKYYFVSYYKAIKKRVVRLTLS